MGGGATGRRHHFGISSNLLQPTPQTSRTIHGSSTPGRTPIQRTDIPGTSPLQKMSTCGFCPRERRPVEPGSYHFPTLAGPHQSQSSPGHPPPSSRSLPPVPLVSHPDPRRPARLRGQSPGLRLCRPQHGRWRRPIYQPASLRRPSPTPEHQPCPSPPLRSRGLDLAGFPCTSGAAGIEMALPGDWPVKQSFTTDLLRQKGAREKKKKRSSTPITFVDTDRYQIASEKRVWWTQMAWMHPRCREGRENDCGPQPPLTSSFQSILCYKSNPLWPECACERPAEVFWCSCESRGAFWLWAPYCPPTGPTSIRRCLSQISTCGGSPTFEPWLVTPVARNSWWLEWFFFAITLEHGMKLWSHRSLTHYWKLAMHFASVPHDRWIQRILSWTPDGRHTAGCPRHNWVTKLTVFARFLQMDEWQIILAQDTTLWLHLTKDFIQFCRP